MGGGDNTTLAVLGCGFMGSALLEGFLAVANTNQRQLSFVACVQTAQSYDRRQQQFAAQASRVKVQHGELSQAAADADVVLLGCAPRDLDEMLPTPGLVESCKGKVIISMLAGVSTDDLQQKFRQHGDAQETYRIARIIPTLGATIGESVTLIADPAAPADDALVKLVDEIFGSVGALVHIPERLMNEATAIGAVCHALSIVAVDAMTDASVADGMPRAAASALIAQSIRSASSLLGGSMKPEQLKEAMSTPSGITLNALVELDSTVRAGLVSTIRNSNKYARSMA